MLKNYLSEKGISYEEKLVDRDTEAMNEMMGVSGGSMGVPFSIITKEDGGQVKILGFDKERINKALGI